MTEMNNIRQELISVLMHGGIAVIRTDTIYGIVARANDEAAVERVFAAKGRNPDKSCIVLVADPKQAYGDLGAVKYDASRPTSILIDAPQAPTWLLRANNLLAHRVPNIPWLREVISETGPLIAPSANPEGMPPASTIEEAEAYFGDAVDLYVDGGKVPSDTPPSALIRIYDDGRIEQLR